MTTERIVAKATDLQDGQMKEVVVGEKTLLLARVDGEFHAVGSTCNHYGGPLAKGVLCGHRVTCPWHQACFDVVTGDLVEPPALNALPHFDVRVEGQDVIASVPDDAKGRRVMPMAKHDPDADGRTFVVLGAGAAGSAAAEALRQAGFQGRVLMITRERHLPYDRPDLSKDYLASADHGYSPMLRSDKFYSNHDIEVLTEREVVRVDAAARAVEFAGGDSLTYDKLLVATGSRPRRLDLPGADLENIFTLRGLDDADRIGAVAEKASHAVVIGAGFIGMEAAASLRKRDVSVTVVAPGPVPFERTLGLLVGRVIQKDHEQNGVSFRLGEQVAGFGGNGEVGSVRLGSGEQLRADLVIVGIGVVPVTGFLDGVGLNPDGSIPVDRRLRAAEDLYAAGDVAQFIDWRSGERIRIEHWRLAEQHGRVAARNMAGEEAEFTGVPFFWTNHFKANLRYVGHATAWDEIIFHGDPGSRKFVAFYVKDGRVLAAAGCGQNMKMCAVAELMRMDRMPTVDELRGGSVDLLVRLNA